jgi:hypothetical protein
MAIVSLVAGILGLTFIPFIGSIVAVITGLMAKKEIQQSAGALGGEGMATAGQILGWVGIALGVIGLCAGGLFILVPLCLGWFALSTNSYGFLFPALLALL